MQFLIVSSLTPCVCIDKMGRELEIINSDKKDDDQM